MNFDDLLALDSALTTVLSSGIVALLTGLLGLVWRTLKTIRKRNELLDKISEEQSKIMDKVVELERLGQKRQEANLASLHDRIYSNFELVFSRKPPRVTIDELNNLEYLWEAYSGLGGNGTGQKMYERINQLPIQEEEHKHG